LTSFWQAKPLDEMTVDEWESLCDGCARCCLHKLEDKDTGEVFYTRVVCRYLDEPRCKCRRYQERNTLVPNCVWLKPGNVAAFSWLPATCAYRLVAEGKELEWWHPLVSGSPDSVHEAGISVRGKILSEDYVHPDGMEEHIIHWVE
tara:strand:+ start:2972 stop:3409 length:438 start_codon:yes stop_codon:yes gene_type:complete